MINKRIQGYIDYMIEKIGAEKKQIIVKLVPPSVHFFDNWVVEVKMKGKRKKKYFILRMALSENPEEREDILYETLKIMFENLQRSIIKNYFTGK